MTAVGDIEVVRPSNLMEARDAMRDHDRGRLLTIHGAGTKSVWGAPGEASDLVVDTTGLGRLVTHDAADATATVEAGMRLADLRSELAGAGQELAVDPPHAGATVGGTFAANDTGPRRLRYGTMRDLVIGMTLVTSDGEVARSGGKVIKNVAGYDLAKLLCGSLGTLGLVAELVVRLHPLPESSATVTAEVDAGAATRIALDLLASPIAASAIDWCAGTLAVRVEGRPAGVADQARDVEAIVGRHGGAPHRLEGDDEAAVWDRVAQAHAGQDGDTTVRAATLPSAFAEVAAAFEHTRAETGAEADLASHLGNGLHTMRLRGGDAGDAARAVTEWRRRIAALGGHVQVRRRPDALTDPDVIWGPPPAAVGLMRAVKEQLDPGRRCARGRFVGGI